MSKNQVLPGLLFIRFSNHASFSVKNKACLFTILTVSTDIQLADY